MTTGLLVLARRRSPARDRRRRARLRPAPRPRRALQRQGRAGAANGGQLELGGLRRDRARLDGDHREPDDAVQERDRDVEAAQARPAPRRARPRPRRPSGSASAATATTSTALEQTGTSADCARRATRPTTPGTSSSPTPSITIKNLKINPGDTITASVVVNGTEVLFQLKNRTRNDRRSRSASRSRAPTSPRPSGSPRRRRSARSNGFCRQIALANFGSVTFTKVAALAIDRRPRRPGRHDLEHALAVDAGPARAAHAQRFFGDVVERPTRPPARRVRRRPR